MPLEVALPTTAERTGNADRTLQASVRAMVLVCSGCVADKGQVAGGGTIT